MSVQNDSTKSEDDLILEKMGYKPVLYRGLGDFTNFAIGFTEVAVFKDINCSSLPFSRLLPLKST